MTMKMWTCKKSGLEHILGSVQPCVPVAPGLCCVEGVKCFNPNHPTLPLQVHYTGECHCNGVSDPQSALKVSEGAI